MGFGFRFLRFDLPYVILGAVLGWNCDVACSISGRSMFPTLAPGDYVLFLPYSILCVLQMFSPRPLVREGDVVVVRISSELTVCKRVVRATVDESVMRQWNDSQFTDILPQQIPFLDNDDSGDTCPSEDKLKLSLAAYARARDWDECLDRVRQPSAWLWLEGDNPSESFDSRNTGAMPLECLRGLVLLKVWPSLTHLPSQALP